VPRRAMNNPRQLRSKTCGCAACIEKYPPEQYGERKKRRDCQGSWEARYRDVAGKQKSKCYETKKLAEAFLDEVRTSVRHRTYLDPKRGEMTLGKWWEEWWPNAQKGVEISTRNRKRRSWQAHIAPAWAGTPLNSLEYMALQTWLTHKVKGYETQRKVLELLRALLRDAVKDKRIPTNPATDVEVTAKQTPKHPEDVRPPTLAQYALVREQVHSWYRPLLDFAQDSGMRWGEYTALRRCNVDLDAGLVYVREVLTDDDGTLRRKVIPKSAAGLRTVPLTPKALDAVQIMLDRLDPSPARTDPEDGMHPEELVFRGPLAGTIRHRQDGTDDVLGSLLTRNNFRRVWIPAIKDAGIARKVKNRETGRTEWWPRVHDYRHAVASRLHEAGVPEADVQAFLGQERGSRVTWLYTHTSDEALGAARNALAQSAGLRLVTAEGARVPRSRKIPTTTARSVSDALGATGTEDGQPL
jgi:integrase